MDMFKVYIFRQESRAAVYGVGTYLALLCKVLKKSRIEFALVNLYGSGFGVKEINEKGYSQINIPSIRNTSVKRKQYYSRNIGYLLKEYIRDESGMKLIFHLNFMTDPILVDSLKSNFPKSKVILVAHYTNWSFCLMGNERELLRIYNKPTRQRTMEERNLIKDLISDVKMIKKADQFVCVAQHTLNTLKKITQIDEDKGLVIYNALSDTYHKISIYEKEQLRKKYRIGIDEHLILFVGRLDEVKGVGYLIKPFRNVLSRFPNSRLVLVGDGNFNQWLSYSANDWSKITFTGRLKKKEVQDFYTMADVGVACSLHEEFGLVAIEMMMNRLPIIVSDVGGLDEIVESEYSGLKSHVRSQKNKRVLSIKDLSEKICRFLKDKEYAEMIAQNGRTTFLNRFEERIFSEKILELYKTI